MQSNSRILIFIMRMKDCLNTKTDYYINYFLCVNQYKILDIMQCTLERISTCTLQSADPWLNDVTVYRTFPFILRCDSISNALYNYPWKKSRWSFPFFPCSLKLIGLATINMRYNPQHSPQSHTFSTLCVGSGWSCLNILTLSNQTKLACIHLILFFLYRYFLFDIQRAKKYLKCTSRFL